MLWLLGILALAGLLLLWYAPFVCSGQISRAEESREWQRIPEPPDDDDEKGTST